MRAKQAIRDIIIILPFLILKLDETILNTHSIKVIPPPIIITEKISLQLSSRSLFFVFLFVLFCFFISDHIARR